MFLYDETLYLHNKTSKMHNEIFSFQFLDFNR